MEEKIKKLWELISTSNKILLINHIRMDMDAFWSLSALFDILTTIWKDVRAVNDEEVIGSFSFTWYNQIIETNLDIKEYNPDLIISLDAASLDQLWNSYKNNVDIFNGANFVVIDHHKTNNWFWKINIIDINSSSTCELLFNILKELSLVQNLTAKSATALLSGIYTDTNIFYNSNTTSSTHHIAWELMDLGADFRMPYFELYKKKTFSASKLWWEVLSSKMKISDNWKLIWALVDKELFKKTNSNDRDLTGLISEFFANIEWVEVSFICYETSNWQVKTSFRSTPNYDTSLIAQSFGWWWHKQAAGFISDMKLEEIEKDILEKIKKEFSI
jgi:phosphoesterase RecJ-like protein